MPMGPYESFEDCVSKNQDKDDPNAYCAAIMHAIEGKTESQKWNNEKKWDKNDRIVEGFVTQERIDNQGDYIPVEVVEKIMPTLVERGRLIEGHSNHIIGEPLGWRREGGKIKMKFGIYSNYLSDDQIWKKIKAAGNHAGFSLGGNILEAIPVCNDNRCWNRINEIEVWEVSWTPTPANIGAKVTDVNMLAKQNDMTDIEKQIRDINAVCGAIWFHGTERQRDAFGGGTEGRGRDESPPRAWWDDCTTKLLRSENIKIAMNDGIAKAQQFLKEKKVTIDTLLEKCRHCRQIFELYKDLGASDDSAKYLTEQFIQNIRVTPSALRDGGFDENAGGRNMTNTTQKQEPPVSPPPPIPEGVGLEKLMALIAELQARIEKLESVSAEQKTPEKETTKVDEVMKTILDRFAEFEKKMTSSPTIPTPPTTPPANLPVMQRRGGSDNTPPGEQTPDQSKFTTAMTKALKTASDWRDTSWLKDLE